MTHLFSVLVFFFLLTGISGCSAITSRTSPAPVPSSVPSTDPSTAHSSFASPAGDGSFTRTTESRVILGVDVLLDRDWRTTVRGADGGQVMISFFDLLLKGRTVGLLTNPTGVDAKLRSTIDLLHEHPDVRLGALFAPEHGIRGDIYAGEAVTDDVEPLTGVPVYSIYRRKPTPAMLAGLDAVLYDIQDIGASSYTYIYAMADMMAACAEAGVPFIVLDRPNPIGADFVDGPVLDTSRFRSGIGQYDIASLYGMTPGELAWMLNSEFLAKPCQLSIIPMANYRRTMRYPDTGLPWVPTSTHIPWPISAVHYSLTGVLGETRGGLNIGVGYTLPFECLAAPWMDRHKLVAAINARNIPGLRARPISYVPGYGGHAGQTVHGAHLVVTDPLALRPMTAQITLMTILQTLYPERKLFDNPGIRESLFDRALGTDQIRLMVSQGADAEAIERAIAPRRDRFKELRRKYLLYEPR
ncbi:exo-beta-N-acetylmuramidase NamZ family protein [Desulfonatronum lacustre]|uniref:exo-beta-N-acetylmuramidase NamZ family protein n=1 Tax=Desulfonatronum lacustre TaxID=66849 RepID=UPI0004BA0F8A|nr:DUF1343 domain-containing protein [Desulfonatronum lacustre]